MVLAKCNAEDVKKRIYIGIFSEAEGHAYCNVDAEEADVMRIFHLQGCFCGSDTLSQL